MVMGGNSSLADKQPGLAIRCGCGWMASSMHRSGGSVCPTITFEEALRREMEYRRRLEKTHPHLLVALNGASETQKFEEVVTAIPNVSKRMLAPECSISAQQSSFSCATTQKQPQNWYPTKKKVKVPQSPSQILQCPRPNAVPSFWCKICKVDCVTEFNFSAHIGGKKHKAKKLEILGNRNTGRLVTQYAGNRNPGQNVHVVSGSRSNESNVSSFTAGPVCDLSSESRIGGTHEN